MAERAARDGAVLIVAVGGDGTVHEAVNGILAAGAGQAVDLAVIPRGTGADFVRTFGIPATVEGAAAVARAQRANATSKALGGRISFLWATLAVFARWRNSEVRVEVDAERREARMLDVIVANCGYLAGGMYMCPGASPDDGLFDVLLIGDITKRDLVATLPKIYRGTHLPHPKAELLRGRSVSVDADTPVPIELDGEQPGTTPVRFEMVPGALRLRVPTQSPSPGGDDG
jgi:diacylglycerol kinase family enzyme